MIHPSALVSDDTQLGDECWIGPYCVLGADGAGTALRIGSGSVLRSHAVVYRGTVTGDRFHAGHGALIREETVIGDDVSVGSHSIVEHHVKLSDGVRLHSGCFVPEYSVLGEGCWIGPGVIVTNARFPNQADTKEKMEGVTIHSGAVVGAGAVLLPGIVVGDEALIGAGAVVTRDVAPGDVVVGNPARSIR